MVKKKSSKTKKIFIINRNVSWIFLLLVALLVLFFIIQTVENAKRPPTMDHSKNNTTGEHSSLDISVWEQGVTDNSETTSPELLSQLKSVLESDPQRTELISSDIQSAAVVKDPNLGYKVTVTLTPAGKTKLLHITERNLGKSIAIVVDGRIVSVDKIQSPIPGGKFEVDGRFTEDEINQLPKNQDVSITTAP